MGQDENFGADAERKEIMLSSSLGGRAEDERRVRHGELERQIDATRKRHFTGVKEFRIHRYNRRMTLGCTVDKKTEQKKERVAAPRQAEGNLFSTSTGWSLEALNSKEACQLWSSPCACQQTSAPQ